MQAVRASRGARTSSMSRVSPVSTGMRQMSRVAPVAVRSAQAQWTPTMTSSAPTFASRSATPLFYRRAYASYPSHNTLGLPALSPTMDKGNLAKWLKKEGDKVSAGDAFAEVETDKATMAWESTDDGYIAKILIPAGTNDVKVGSPALVIVEEQDDVAAFKDYSPESSSGGDAKKEAEEKKSAPKAEEKKSAPKAEEKKSEPSKPSKSYPSHNELGLPALSPTMAEGQLQKWNKKEGDKVSAGDIIASIETDKAVMDWESVDEGYVAKLLVSAGSTPIKVGTPVLVLADDEGDIAAFKEYEPSGPKQAEKKVEKTEEKAEPASSSSSKSEQPAAKTAAAPSSSSDRVSASPYARKVAAEKGVDLSALSGTGPNNRIIAADVLEYKPTATKETTKAAAQPSAQKTAAAQPSASGSYTDLPNSSIRKVIARRLTESKQTIPHYYLTVECRVDKLLKMREDFNRKGEGKYKLSVNDFVIKASALALKQQPTVNSSWAEEAIRRYNNVDINVAVNTPDGLFTPYVPDADRKGLVAISSAVKELAQKAKDKKLTPKDYEGGTFTISNLGMFGISQFAAVINPPQAAILAVGGTSKRLVTNTDVMTAKAKPYEEASYLTVTLSCDHRVVDGAVGAEWLQAFKAYMEDPLRMLL